MNFLQVGNCCVDYYYYNYLLEEADILCEKGVVCGYTIMDDVNIMIRYEKDNIHINNSSFTT